MPPRRFMLLLILILVAFSVLLVAIGLYMLSGLVSAAGQPVGWQETGGGQVSFYHVPADRALAGRLKTVAEPAWQKLSGLLSVPDGTPVDVYLYPSRAQFEQAGGAAGIDGAVGPDGTVSIMSTPATRDRMAQVILEQLARLALQRSCEGRQAELPQWVLQGVAGWAGYTATEGDSALYQQAKLFEYMLAREGRPATAAFLTSAHASNRLFDEEFTAFFGESPGAFRAGWTFRSARSDCVAAAVGFGGCGFALAILASRRDERPPVGRLRTKRYSSVPNAK